MMGGPLASDNLNPNDFPSRQREQPCGTTSALVSWLHSGGNHHVPTSLRSTVVTRFFATTDALTPTGPFVAACRGSLIHVSLTSDHAVSNHPCCSLDRKSTRLNSSHLVISYAVFCLKKKKNSSARPPLSHSGRGSNLARSK